MKTMALLWKWNESKYPVDFQFPVEDNLVDANVHNYHAIAGGIVGSSVTLINQRS